MTDPVATRAGRVKSCSKKLCKFVHYCAVYKMKIWRCYYCPTSRYTYVMGVHNGNEYENCN
ncbi:hypothetical protein D6Z12_02825 [Escherichia coli]|nr:hypothetical protein [Escherichia coli]EFB9662956.1 hypothetical protein [Escherichia coli]